MNATAHPTVSLTSLAQEALSANDGKTEAAVTALNKRLGRDKNLRLAVVAQAVAEAARTTVSLIHRRQRAEIVRSLPTMGQSREAVTALASGMARSLLDFPLLDGTKLRDATRDDLTKTKTELQASAVDLVKRMCALEEAAEKEAA